MMLEEKTQERSPKPPVLEGQAGAERLRARDTAEVAFHR